MLTLSTDKTVGQLVTERSSRARVFERLGIDYCCGGNQRLIEACERLGLDPEAVLRDLETCRDDSAEGSTDWSTASLAELMDHILSIHHQYLREALPRLALLVDKVAVAHGERHPELLTVQSVFVRFRSDLEAHMAKEEEVLFPMCQALETAYTLPALHCGTVRNPIRVMLHEHDEAGAALVVMRRLTNNFAPPADACVTYRAMLDGLAELEVDLHRHVHEENNILFPRATAAEAALLARQTAGTIGSPAMR